MDESHASRLSRTDGPRIAVLCVACLDSEKLPPHAPESVPGTCHSHMPLPVPSWPAHLLRNVPLQPLGSHKHGVRLAQAVPGLCVAQVEGVSAQDKLQGEDQAEKPPSHPAPSLPGRTPSEGPLPPRGAL